MAERLKSISKRIHWSLILKAAVFAATWLWLPFWLFLLAALYLYFRPLFQAWKLLLPFLTVIIFALIETPGPWWAVLLGALFYLILGVKDLIFVDRPAAYETLVLAIIFLSLVKFLSYFNAGLTAGALWHQRPSLCYFLL